MPPANYRLRQMRKVTAHYKYAFTSNPMMNFTTEADTGRAATPYSLSESTLSLIISAIKC